jgi:cytochrome P450
MAYRRARSVHLPTATLGETLGVLADVIVPTVAKGVIIRRPTVVGLAERLDLDRRAVRRVQRLRNRYGEGPLLLRIPLRSQAVVLSAEHVHRVLDETPEPFATATQEKRAALAHFQPQGALISHGADRQDRRRYNEAVLDTGRRVHRLAERFRDVVGEEARLLLEWPNRRGVLTWHAFAVAHFRVVRRVVFGDAAREDHELSRLMARLRADANWAFLRPRRTHVRRRFFEHMRRYVDVPEPNTLAEMMARVPITPRTEPLQQIPQWLFAFDPAGMTTFRALALLASHPEQARRAREEVDHRADPARAELPRLRATVLESLRLWPTTPLVLRETTADTTWHTGRLPAGTGLLIFAPFFHRDDQRLQYADRFTPELWLDGRTAHDAPLIPFSAGPAACPGRHLVLLLTSEMLAALIAGHDARLTDNRLSAERPLPGTLDNYTLRFRLRPRDATRPGGGLR